MSETVHVRYWFTDHLDQEAVRSLVLRLSAAERSQCAAFALQRDRRDFAAAHVLLREALSLRGGRPPGDWTFRTDRYGKPHLAQDSAGLQFNLSHTHGLVACAVTQGVDVGIDVEQIRNGSTYEELHARYLCDAEVAELTNSPVEERAGRFIEFWTLKEAYIKAVGHGLSMALNSFGFRFSGTSSLVFEPSTEIDPAEWQFALYAPADDYRLSLAAHVGATGRRNVVINVQQPHGDRHLPRPPLRRSN